MDTPNNMMGNSYAEYMSKGYVEMTGAYRVSRDPYELLIFYPFDEIRVKDNRRIFIEHKWVRDFKEIESWFFQSSICQIALLASLHQFNKRRIYMTANFRVKEGHQKDVLDLSITEDTKELYILNFGGIMFEVTIDAEPIVDYYVAKAMASIHYDTAKQWDAEYKYKDYDMICDHLSFNRISQRIPIIKVHKNIMKENIMNMHLTMSYEHHSTITNFSK